jgi:mevalonate kinase
MKVTVSAPGKLMLFGEHAVLANKPSIVTAVDKRMYVTIEILNRPELQLHAREISGGRYVKSIKELGKGEIPKGARFVEFAVRNIFEKFALAPLIRGVKVTSRSEFSSQVGFGSSAASTTCVIKGMSEMSGVKLKKRQIFELGYETVLNVQKAGSGFDIACAVYGGVLYFVGKGEVIKPLTVHDLPLLVAYSGKKADTVGLLGKVEEAFSSRKPQLNKIYNKIGQLAERAKEKLERKNWPALGKLMSRNQEYLRELGVSTEKLDMMIESAMRAGAYGAKLSGAGGGDCMIAIVPEDKQRVVEKVIAKSGGEIILVKANEKGVRIEK